jgi:hypothetical protein
MSNRKTNEFENFDRAMRRLMVVPHSEVEVQLDAEKITKKRKTPRKSNRGQ